MINWATATRMRCSKMPTLIFLSLAPVRSTAVSIANGHSRCDKLLRLFLFGTCFLSMLPAVAAESITIHVRLSPGPRLVGTRAESSGGGSVTATLAGSELTLQGSFSGLLGLPTGAHLFMGSLPGVRGPLIANLTISPATGHIERHFAAQCPAAHGPAQGRPVCGDR